MNIQQTTEVQMGKPLPQLIKQSATYKLFVPKKVEEKIRYLIRKFPHTEWSGVLFYKHTGTFEKEDLEIHCEDLFPMDLGTGGWTEFKMTPDVTAYMAENIELFECEMGLIHSHHTLTAFFSGQDIKTLQIEGNDTNCFVSLIVDTRGTYQAAITRKVNKKKEVITKIYGSTYEFFGDGIKVLDGGGGDGIRTDVSETIIEYFMLDVTREETNNPFDYLDTRFEEIERQKKPATPIINTEYSRVYDPKKGDTTLVKLGSDYDEDISFREYLNKPKEVKQPALFGEDIMEEMVDPTKWNPDPTIIHKLLTQMITCSLIVGEIDLKQWVTRHMEKKYEEIFKDTIQLESWMEFIIEFTLAQYPCDNVPDSVLEDFDTYQCKIAEALADEMGELPCNPYLEQLGEILGRYMFGC